MRWGRYTHFLLPLAIFALNICITWNRWADPLVDSGRELHTPARIVQGERLYTDIYYYYGPLAPYLNAAAYKLFGTHALTLAWTGIVITAVGLLALYRIGLHFLTPWRAAISVTTVSAIPLFLPMLGTAPMPYSYGALYSSVLGWWALLTALHRSRGWEWKTGILLGLSACSKPEIAANFILAIVLGTAVTRWKQWDADISSTESPVSNKLRSSSMLLLPLTAIVLIAYVPFLSLVPTQTLWTEGFLTMLHLPPEWKTYYFHISGFDWPGIRLLELFVVLIAFGSLLIPFIFLGIHTSKNELDRRGLGLAVAFALFTLSLGAALIWRPAWLGSTARNLPPVVRILPPACAVWASVSLYRFLKKNPDPAVSTMVPPALILAAALTSWRVLLNARYASGYSAFSLVLPVFLAGIVLLKFWPSYMDRRIPGSATRFLALGIAALLCWQTLHIAWNFRYFRTPARWWKVQVERGTFWITPPERGRLFGEALAMLRKQAKPGESLAAFPEGSLFNFLTNLQTPLHQEQLLPGMLDSVSEKALMQRLDQNPPEWIVVNSADYSFFGAGRFGIDFYLRIGQFIQENYVMQQLFHSVDPRPAGGFGTPVIAVYRHKSQRQSIAE